MPWTLRLVENPTQEDKQTPGVVYFAPWAREGGRLSVQYKRDWADKRDPICLVIPGYGAILLDAAYYPETSGQEGHGWIVTGEVPKLTASPSLGIGRNAEGRWHYHGWLKDGVLSDDIEGRTYGNK